MPDKRKILLVDDNPKVTYMVGALLNRMGQNYQLLLATTKDKALEILGRQRPQVVILDIDLYGIASGLEILGIVNDDYKSTKTIVITGRAKDYRTSVEKIGCFHFFEKPFDMKDLNDRIREALGLESIAREKEPAVLEEDPEAKLLFIEPNLRHYAYLCSIFDAQEMLDGAKYSVKILDHPGNLLSVLADYQPDGVLIGDYFLEDREIEVMIDLLLNTIKIKPKFVIVHGLFERDEIFELKLKKLGVVHCIQNVMDNEEILKMNRKLAGAVARECIDRGLTKKPVKT